MFYTEWTEQTHFDKTNTLTLARQVVDNFFNNITGRTHSNNNAFSFRISVVVKWFIFTSSDRFNSFHSTDNNAGNLVIVWVGAFSVLEICVRVLCCTALMRIFRVQSTVTESLDIIPVNNFFDIFIVNHFNFADFMRSTESVKEVTERNRRINSSKVGS